MSSLTIRRNLRNVRHWRVVKCYEIGCCSQSVNNPSIVRMTVTEFCWPRPFCDRQSPSKRGPWRSTFYLKIDFSWCWDFLLKFGKCYHPCAGKRNQRRAELLSRRPDLADNRLQRVRYFRRICSAQWTAMELFILLQPIRALHGILPPVLCVVKEISFSVVAPDEGRVQFTHVGR